MATISIASAKGGCGKTTRTILLGTELALEGYKVALLDCDVNQHATAYGKRSQIAGFVVVPSIDEGNILSALAAARIPVASLRIEIPAYLDDELTQRAAALRVTKQYLVLSALRQC